MRIMQPHDLDCAVEFTSAERKLLIEALTAASQAERSIARVKRIEKLITAIYNTKPGA